MACLGCNGPMFFHEREAHPQDFCQRCAEARGLDRICDAAGPDAAAIAERVVDEMLPPADAATVRADVDRIMARVRQEHEEAHAKFRASTAMIGGPLDAGDVVVLVIDGVKVPADVVEGMIETIIETCPERMRDPVIVVPHGWGDRCRAYAELDHLHDIAAAIVEAPPVAELEVIAPMSARERSWYAWFVDRDDISDDELTEILAELSEASWDEIEAVLDERQQRRAIRSGEGSSE